MPEVFSINKTIIQINKEIRSKIMRETLKKMISYYKPYKGVFFTDMFFAIMASAVALVIPLVVRYVTSTAVSYTHLAAAGNNGPGANSISTPGDCKKIITVGADNDLSLIHIYWRNRKAGIHQNRRYFIYKAVAYRISSDNHVKALYIYGISCCK